MSAHARRRLVAPALLIALTSLAVAGIAQTNEDPRNTSEDYFDAIDGAQCMSHHEDWGMRPMSIGLAARYPQLVVDERQDLTLTVRDPWSHQIKDIMVTLNTTEAPNIVVLTDGGHENIEKTGIAARVPRAPADARPSDVASFEVLDNATTVVAYARITDAPLGNAVGPAAGVPPRIRMAVHGASRSALPAIATGTDAMKTVRLEGQAVADLGIGGWQLKVGYDEPGLDDEIGIEVGYFVGYNRTAVTEHRFFAAGVVLREGEAVSLDIPIKITSEDEARLDFRVQVRTEYEHSTGANAANEGIFVRFLTMNTKGGDHLVTLAGAAVPQAVAPQVEILGLFTRTIGFVSAFLVPVAMVTGGMFGKASRRAMNRWVGGARRRVLWHAAMSWAILGAATLHLALALLEASFAWTKGILWGGVGWLLLLSLGATGYWQTTIIKRWGYRPWRSLHLWSAVGVFVFAGLHTFIDGSDLGAVREAWPWLQRLAWP